jgi:hypothetical protein
LFLIHSDVLALPSFSTQGVAQDYQTRQRR